jgi:hypothetical protein
MVATARSAESKGSASISGGGASDGGASGGFTVPGTSGGAKRRSSKVYEPDLSLADESLLAEIDVSVMLCHACVAATACGGPCERRPALETSRPPPDGTAPSA